MEMPSRTQSILIAGVATGVLGLVISLTVGAAGAAAGPSIGGILAACVTCMLYVAAGAVAAWHYTNTYEITIPGGTGASMGALAGMLAWIVASASSIAMILTGRTAQVQQEMLRQMEESGATSEQAEQMVEWFPAIMIGSLVVFLLVAAILGAVGGAVGASMFKRGGQGGRSADSF